MDEVNFAGRRPSLAQCIKAAKLSAKRGQKEVRFCWGENWCEVSQQSNGRWTGYGWLRTIDADKIAQALNQGQAVDFMRSHFQIVHID